MSPCCFHPVFPILGVFRLNGQPKRDGSIIVRSCKASQSPVYPIRDAILAVNHVSCPSLSSSGPRQWGESALSRDFPYGQSPSSKDNPNEMEASSSGPARPVKVDCGTHRYPEVGRFYSYQPEAKINPSWRTAQVCFCRSSSVSGFSSM